MLYEPVSKELLTDLTKDGNQVDKAANNGCQTGSDSRVSVIETRDFKSSLSRPVSQSTTLSTVVRELIGRLKNTEVAGWRISLGSIVREIP